MLRYIDIRPSEKKWLPLCGFAVAAFIVGSIFLPITRMQALCCFGDQCEWVEGKMTHGFARDIAELPIAGYVPPSRHTAYVSWWHRWTLYPPEIFMKHTRDITRWHFENRSPENRPHWWPKRLIDAKDCCSVYPIALTEASWREVSRWKPRCGRDGRRAR